MEQALVFASIVLGVAVAFELENLNRVLRSKRVKWHWAQPVFALFVLLSIVSYWWMAANKPDGEISLAQFLPIMFQLVVLVLLAAVSLPDTIGKKGVDLATYYDDNRRYQWGLMALYYWSLHIAYISSLLGKDLPVDVFLLNAVPDTIGGLVIVGMIFAQRWWLVALGFAIIYLAPLNWAFRTLG